MAMTAQVKAELASTQITKTCCRKAEVASMLRFAGGLHIVSGRIVVEAELDTGAAARRLRKDISEVYGHPSDVVMVQGNGIRKGSRYIVRVTKDGEALARQTGLLDQRGRPVRGLPPAVVSGGGCDAVAAWRTHGNGFSWVTRAGQLGSRRAISFKATLRPRIAALRAPAIQNISAKVSATCTNTGNSKLETVMSAHTLPG